MDEDLLTFTVHLAKKLGADYAEARLHKKKITGCLLRNGVPEPATIGDSYGMGIRVICSGSLAFSATNNLSKGNLKVIVENVIKRAKLSSSLVKNKIFLSKEKAYIANWRAEEKKNIENISFEDLFRVLSDIDIQIKGGFAGVSFLKRLLVLKTFLEEKILINSDGTKIISRVPRLNFHSYITTSYEGRIDTITIPSGYSQLGGTGGWELIDRLNIYEYVKKEAVNLALVMKNNEKPPKEIVDVVLGPNISGLIAHESVGHPNEADRILGREAAQAGESYLKCDDIGRKIGSEEAYVSDDPTLLHSYGFYHYDDEGVPSKKRTLIKEGVINEFLHDRTTAYEFRVISNGASRSTSYNREPIIRMANTYVEPGDFTSEELFEDINLGVYIKSFMEWNIDDIRFNQRYVGLEAYLIEKGEVKGIVRNPILEIITPKLWSSLDARGKKIEFVAGICGKGDPMQDAPVWTGGPDMRIRAIKIGVR